MKDIKKDVVRGVICGITCFMGFMAVIFLGPCFPDSNILVPLVFIFLFGMIFLPGIFFIKAGITFLRKKR